MTAIEIVLMQEYFLLSLNRCEGKSVLQCVNGLLLIKKTGSFVPVFKSFSEYSY